MSKNIESTLSSMILEMKPDATISPENKMQDDLGFDSLDMIKLFFDLEKKLV